MNKLKIGVFAVILNSKNEVLLLKRRDKDMWNLPGGGVEKGELYENALLREITEEIGKIVPLYWKLYKAYFKKKQKEIVLVYRVGLSSFEFTPNEEAVEIGFFNLKELPLNLFKSHKKRILDIMKGR